MPNYYTHITFGAQVLAALPTPLRDTLEMERSAYDLGCLGPDILFFYRPVRREGTEMHKRSALPAFQRLRAGVADGEPMSGGYAAGFLCHLALDSACHPYITAVAARGGITHLAMEAELDRTLMERAGLPAKRHTYMPRPTDPAVWRAAALAYQQAGPEDVARGCRAMGWDTKLLARFYGSRTGRVATRLSRHLPRLKDTVGVILDRAPAPACAETTPTLLELLGRTVPVAAGQIVRFFDAARAGAPLDPWLDRDFTGRLAPASPQKAAV